MTTIDFVSIVIPTLNEASYIERAIRSLVPAGVGYEILVVDGGSTDGTREIVSRLAGEIDGLRLVDNPKRIQASAMNLAARVADERAKVFVKADAHCSYPPGFVVGIVDAMARTGAQSVVVPMRTIGRDTCLQVAAAAAQNSLLGNGGSAHRGRAVSGWVEHGHHAGFDRETFLRLGGYDESFSTNEDAEFDVRLVASGGKIWMLSEATIDYFPRKTVSALARQYFNHGRGRGMTVLKHRTLPRVRQLAPVAALAGCAAGLGLSALNSVFLALPATYAGGCITAGLIIGRQYGRCGCMAGLAAMVMHLSWGAGFLTSIAKAVPSALSRRVAKGRHEAGSSTFGAKSA